MWIYEPGKVNSDLYLLGRKEVPLYLFKSGPEWLLVDGGLLREETLVLSQLKAIVPDLNDIRHWFITHSHFDHCGLLGTLLPQARIYAAEAAIQNFMASKYRAMLYKLHRSFLDEPPAEQVTNPYDALATKDFVAVGEGDQLTIGDHTFTVLATPGHSECSLSLYSDHQYLFAADAFGEMLQPDDWFPLPFQSPPQYFQSIERLQQLPVSLIAVGHHGLLTDEHARQLAGHSLRTHQYYARYFETLFRQHGLEEASRLVTEKYSHNSRAFFSTRMHQASVRNVITILHETGYIEA